MYALLGEVVFDGLIGPSSFSHDVETSYAQQDRLLNKPRLQRTGEGLINISLSFKFHSRFCDPQAQLDQLELYRSSSEVVPFIRGNGRLEGNFVIINVNHVINQWDRQGQPIDMDVNIKLREYVAAGTENTDNEGFAATQNAPLANLEDNNPTGDAAQLGNDVNALFDGSGQVNNSLDAATIDPDTEAVELAKVTSQCDQMQSTVDEIEEGANKESIFDEAAQLRAIITDIRNAITNIRDFAAVGDLDNAKLAAANFDIFKQNIRQAAAPIAANGSVRGS